MGINHKKQPVREACEALYEGLRARGIEVLYDDRSKRSGFAFADADLIGCPFRVVVSPRTLGDGEVELSRRDKTVETRVPQDSVVDDVVARIIAERERYARNP